MKAKSALVLFLFCFSFAKSAFAADILINEFVANPQTGESEWVEFYNTTNATVDLSDYFFDDDTNFDSDSGSSTKIALAGLLSTFQTCFWELSSYLNNNGDIPSLFKIGNATAIDTYTYSSSSAGFSYSRIPDGGSWFVLQTPTKSSNKCIDLAPTVTPTSAPTPTPTVTPTPTLKLTPTPTVTKATSKTPTPTENKASPTANEQVLGDATSNTKNDTSNKSTEKTSEDDKLSINLLPIVFISIGIVFLLACVIVILYPYIRHYFNKNNE